MNVRLSPSGKIISPAPGAGNSSWNALAPLVVELLPANHQPGLWSFSIATVQIVAATGFYSIVLSWDQPFVGAVSRTFNASIAMNAIGNGFIAPRHVMSSGRAPLVMTLTPTGVVGSPRVYANFPVDNILALLPEDF